MEFNPNPFKGDPRIPHTTAKRFTRVMSFSLAWFTLKTWPTRLFGLELAAIKNPPLFRRNNVEARKDANRVMRAVKLGKIPVTRYRGPLFDVTDSMEHRFHHHITQLRRAVQHDGSPKHQTIGIDNWFT